MTYYIGYSVSSVIYPDNQGAVIGMIEMSQAVGLSIAPVLGAVLYAIGGFSFPFYVFGISNSSGNLTLV
jgi:MFS family permease